MNEQITKAWRQYEAGKEYKRRIGLYETARQNERFYRGDQWHGSTGKLPRPVFNLVRRITDYLVCSVLPGDLTIRYCDDKLPYLENETIRKQVIEGLEILETSYADEDYAICVNKDNAELLAKIDEAIVALTADGTIDAIVAKYIK